MMRGAGGFGWRAVTLWCLAAGVPGLGQQGGGLDETLRRLGENYKEYMGLVPNLMCNERVLSEYGPYFSVQKTARSVTESVFRLRRRVGVGPGPPMVESRDVQRVNGKAVAEGELSGPSILFGVFGTALALVSPWQERCMHYQMSMTRKEPKRIVVSFQPLPPGVRDPGCNVRHSSGRALIDPETMHIRRLEMTTKGYEITKNVIGDWSWTADYDPAVLGGKAFWLPRRIWSEAVGYGRERGEWTFEAQYSGCHKLAASGRIVPGTTREPDAAGSADPR